MSRETCKYGDYENVKADARTLHDIAGRQGVLLLIDVIAEQIGQTALTFNFTPAERSQVINKYAQELREAIAERV